MAFIYTGGASSTNSNLETTGNRAGCTRVGPNLFYAFGTWNANGEATGTIDTGMLKVLYCSVSNNEDTSETPKTRANLNGAGATANGSIGLTAIAVNTNTGNWFAIGRN